MSSILVRRITVPRASVTGSPRRSAAASDASSLIAIACAQKMRKQSVSGRLVSGWKFEAG